MTDRMFEWVQGHPGAAVRLGFGPMLCMLLYQAVTNVIDFPWLALFMVPMVLAAAVMVHYLAKFAELNARWNRERRDS